MTFIAYREEEFDYTHENQIFDELIKKCQLVWGNTEDLVLLFGNISCEGAEIDALLIKKKGIIVIDFKNYGGILEVDENNTWYADGEEVKGGNKINPYRQIRDNRYSVMDFFKKKDLVHKRVDLGHISGMVLFHKPILPDEAKYSLPESSKPWLHIVDFDHVIENVNQIASPKITLSNKDIERIAKDIGIQKYKIPDSSSFSREADFEIKNQTSIASSFSSTTSFDLTFFHKASWDNAQLLIRPSTHLVAFNPNKETEESSILDNFDFDNKALKNLYLHICNSLHKEEAVVTSVTHSNYKEIYTFENTQNQKFCILELQYNKKYHVTSIKSPQSMPEDFAKNLIFAITSLECDLDSMPSFDNNFQEEVYSFIKRKLSFQEVKIYGVEHNQNHEIYYLKKDQESIKIRIDYNNKNYVTRIAPLESTTLDFADFVQSIFVP